MPQVTGLKDKNGKDIYEGDILRLDDGDVSHHKIYWEYKEARWFDQRIEDGDSQTAYDCFDFVTECEVIGNIYQNPELLNPWNPGPAFPSGLITYQFT